MYPKGFGLSSWYPWIRIQIQLFGLIMCVEQYQAQHVEVVPSILCGFYQLAHLRFLNTCAISIYVYQ